MEFANEFEVAAPVDEVFATLLDIERVAPCVPGAKVLESTGPNAYKVVIKVKLGPVSMQYRGDVEILNSDPSVHTATMRVRVKESRGQGNADATSRIALAERGPGTHATISTEVKLSGKAAAMGGRMLGDVSASMIDAFAVNVASMLEREGQAEPPRAEPEAPAGDPAAAPGDPTQASSKPAEVSSEPPLAAARAPAELDAVALAGDAIVGRLREPQALACALASAFVIGVLVGRRAGRG